MLVFLLNSDLYLISAYSRWLILRVSSYATDTEFKYWVKNNGEWNISEVWNLNVNHDWCYCCALYWYVVCVLRCDRDVIALTEIRTMGNKNIALQNVWENWFLWKTSPKCVNLRTFRPQHWLFEKLSFCWTFFYWNKQLHPFWNVRLFHASDLTGEDPRLFERECLPWRISVPTQHLATISHENIKFGPWRGGVTWISAIFNRYKDNFLTVYFFVYLGRVQHRHSHRCHLC